MGVAVLNPQDSLRTPLSQQALMFPSPKMRFLKPAANSKPKPNQDNRSGTAKRSSLRSENNLHPTQPTEKPQVNKLSSSNKTAGLYAGSHMFVASPPPSSVPLPDFLKTVTNSVATSDLRRILGLDLPN